MKKFLTYAFALLILIFTFSLTACGAGDVGDKSYMESQSAANEVNSQAESSQAQGGGLETLQSLQTLRLLPEAGGLVLVVCP